MNDKIHVLYFLSDDCDNEDCPNVFSFPVPRGAREVTLADIRKHFPLPGAYYFSSKVSFNQQPVWVDLVDDKQKVKIKNGMINLKISRIGILSNLSRSKSSTSTPKVRASSPLLPSFNAPHSAPQQRSYGTDLLDFGEMSSESPSKPLTKNDSFDMFLDDSSFQEADGRSPTLESQLENLNWSIPVRDLEKKKKKTKNIEPEKRSKLNISSSQQTLQNFLRGPSVSLHSLANDIEIGC